MESVIGNPSPTLKELAAENGLNYEVFRSRLRRKGSIIGALNDVGERITSFPINGIDLTAEEWCHYIGISTSAMYRSAKRRKITSLQELQRRFQEQPQLFPKHLLDPKHPRHAEVAVKS